MRLTELMPVARAVDWNGDGTVNAQDDWIEIHNAARREFDLGGWTLETGGRSYRIPAGTQLPMGGYIAIFARQSGLSLDDGGGQVRLLDPEGRLIDEVSYPALPPDTSYSRDSGNGWHGHWPPSPNRQNAPPNSSRQRSNLS